MAISGRAYSLVSDALEKAGFEVGKVFCGDIGLMGGRYAAFISVERAALSELGSSGSGCRAEVEISARLCSADKGFFGAEQFSELCEKAAGAMYFGSTVLIKKAELSALKKNMKLGRLERTLSVTAVYTITREEAQT